MAVWKEVKMRKAKAVAVRTQMASLVKEWSRSGETGRTFAARKGITAAKLFYWKLRLVGPDRSRGRRTHRFVPVRLVGRGKWSGAEVSLEIVLESGERVRISEGASEETLRREIRILRERC